VNEGAELRLGFKSRRGTSATSRRLRRIEPSSAGSGL